ncbi:MAG: site-specific DNA-methyltransferase [Rickettsiales bacterium]|nr:site-specific DNA-methyltransferase [Pseudomonadota bacterium]MDA0966870.1 site-specific DNA-methyltransferase [Pseudomonadota bacterium]MDG4543545.1 site-specific DNA-methyltransferase [Rickettsiales bacterium]MDG4545693.1 site-specific DNA-methyltransferase [Rickettsiales bacterium]MDG4547534.1 site-specific DNA-methyltransferase [Rickettsiales bacterium]
MNEPIKNNTIINGDCLSILPGIEDKSIDMVLCDLPYGITSCEWDKVINPKELWDNYWRITKNNAPVVLTATQPFATDLVNAARKFFRYEIIWSKTRSTGFLNAKKMPLRKHENILVFYKALPTYNPQFTEGKAYKTKSRSVSRIYRNAKRIETVNEGKRYPVSIQQFNHDKGGMHPTQKPVAMFEWLINTYTNVGDVVLDNCSGSGTTAIACINTQRNYICIEQDEKYFNSSLERVSQHLSKQREGGGESL